VLRRMLIVRRAALRSPFPIPHFARTCVDSVGWARHLGLSIHQPRRSDWLTVSAGCHLLFRLRPDHQYCIAMRGRACAFSAERALYVAFHYYKDSFVLLIICIQT